MSTNLSTLFSTYAFCFRKNYYSTRNWMSVSGNVSLLYAKTMYIFSQLNPRLYTYTKVTSNLLNPQPSEKFCNQLVKKQKITLRKEMVGKSNTNFGNR